MVLARRCDGMLWVCTIAAQFRAKLVKIGSIRRTMVDMHTVRFQLYSSLLHSNISRTMPFLRTCA